MANPDDEPFSPSRATGLIREMARSGEFGIVLTRHAAQRIRRRDLILDDVLHVLKNVFRLSARRTFDPAGRIQVRDRMQDADSGRRSVRVVVIPSADRKAAKIVTVMWADEPMQSG